ncbi:TPA: hypothetical protein HA281_02570 [Candidatus Woesearchaeota archaeon]|nr:MAG: hypothetical protein QT04_C0051G0013 [archaeon GW2011_AR11]MBS3110614.1 UPF0147 family protein [Candidatus Woesearchaeota archaeon]HIH05241.1 hypothetical protein [Candidatus Woesearchaeota archaeon]HIH91661.1 hypothetical protein [Candidatus Woesearchaeota archaeon]HII64718.1 hypothetical protein [Candidatus Woesearchaeota archaeon]
MKAEQLNPLADVITVLGDIASDQNVPRNVRARMQGLLSRMQSPAEQSVKVHDAHNALDEVSGDINLDPFTRTQVYSAISMLEKLQ